MMNYNCNFSPKKVLDRLFDLLNDERIEKLIDEPIDLAVHTFKLKIGTPITHSEFKRVVSVFIRHLYKNGLRLPQHLPDHKAFAEAVYLLEKYYLNGGSNGFDGALLDAVSTNMEGFELVLYRLAESIKSAERQKYLKWVFIDNFFNLNWEFRKRIVSFYLKQNEALVTPEIYDLDPARLVDCFHELFISHVLAESMVDQVLSADKHQNS